MSDQLYCWYNCIVMTMPNKGASAWGWSLFFRFDLRSNQYHRKLCTHVDSTFGQFRFLELPPKSCAAAAVPLSPLRRSQLKPRGLVHSELVSQSDQNYVLCFGRSSFITCARYHRTPVWMYWLHVPELFVFGYAWWWRHAPTWARYASTCTRIHV